MPILRRPAREEDLERSDQLVIASINDLTQRHGFGPMAAAHPPEFQLSLTRQKPPVAKPLDKTSDLIRKGQNLPANV
jgi:hypothetical protein